jgi:hypothetical protein
VALHIKMEGVSDLEEIRENFNLHEI